MALQPGEILDGKYRIVRLVGEGGMGAVYEGENTRIKRKVAIKVLHAAVAEKQDVVQRFEREAQAAGRIGSEHIVEVLDLGNLPSGERYMVMEFLEGEDLTSRIKRNRRLSPDQAMPLLDQVLEGLAAAHAAGIVHRDLKPDNIYILAKNAGRVDFVKILDFGVSKFNTLDNEMSMTRTGAVMGTPYYMSPEQAKGGQIDPRSDVYSIGVVLYQMVTGRVPFNAGSFNELLFKIVLESPEPVERLAPGLDAHFTGIVNKAMAREPEHRFQSAREFQEALRQWKDSARARPMPPPPPSRAGSSPSLSSAPAGSGEWRSHPPLGTSQPGLATSSPAGGVPGAFALAQQTPIPGMNTPIGVAAMGQAAMQAPLALSQPALAVTPAPKGKSGMVVALAVVFVALVGAGSAGAYLLTRQAHAGPPGQAAAAQPGPAADPASAEPAKTAAPATTTASESETAQPAKTAEPEAGSLPEKNPGHLPGLLPGRLPAPPSASSAKKPPPAASSQGKPGGPSIAKDL